MSVFACEFDTRWVEHALENGKWPERGAEADRLFNRYHGRLSTLTRIYCELVRNTAQISVVWMN